MGSEEYPIFWSEDMQFSAFYWLCPGNQPEIVNFLEAPIQILMDGRVVAVNRKFNRESNEKYPIVAQSFFFLTRFVQVFK